MAIIKKKKKVAGRKTRKKFTLYQKFKAIQWKTRDNMSPKEIRAKLKEEFDIIVAPGTLAGWYTDEMVKKFNNMATDRIMVPDVHHNPKQRPDILVDMENILKMKCDAVASTGIPYIYSIIRLLALHIFHKLLASNLYDSKGQRKDQNMVLDEEVINSVQHARLLTQYMASSCKKTEYHKSMDVKRNSEGITRYNCNQCKRSFTIDINLTLHVYWHTCLQQKEKARKKV